MVWKVYERDSKSAVWINSLQTVFVALDWPSVPVLFVCKSFVSAPFIVHSICNISGCGFFMPFKFIANTKSRDFEQ